VYLWVVERSGGREHVEAVGPAFRSV
jgi:hypothetical protein